MTQTFTSDIINLNVGGTKFSTSRQTLCSIQDSFFSSLLSGRIPSCRDEHGYVFIDRDPKYFSIILNFLRTKELNINGVDDISVLRSEAEFYAITPLVKRLLLCEDLERSLCGDVLFTGFIPAPLIISKNNGSGGGAKSTTNELVASSSLSTVSSSSSSSASSNASTNSSAPTSVSSATTIKPGNVLRLFTGNVSNFGVIKGQNEPVNSRNSQNDLINNANSNNNGALNMAASRIISHSRKSSNEISHLSYAPGGSTTATATSNNVKCHSRNQSLELKPIKTDLGILLTDYNSNTNIKDTFSNNHTSGASHVNNSNLQVNLIVGHHNWISVAYSHYVCCYKLKDGMGWQLIFQSNYIEEEIERLAFNSKHQLGSLSNLLNTSNSSSGPTSNSSLNSTTGVNSNSMMSSNSNSGSNLMASSNVNSNSGGSLLSNAAVGSSLSSSFAATINQQNSNPLTPSSPIPNQPIPVSFSTTSPTQQSGSGENSKLCALLAISFKGLIRLWLITDETNTHLIGNFNLNAIVDNLFFIGSQLVATSNAGKIGVWNSLSQLWQTQDITPISSFDTAGSVLLLGGQNGVLYYIDMQKFPLRMKDNDLLVTQLYKDPVGDPITALSVYLTPKTSNTGNWIEIAYGTSTGQVRVIVQHPETVGHGPQLFQSFSVHRGSVLKVMLTEKHLVSVCSEFNHVRTWNVTRFRGMISTQPGSTPLASFKIVTIDAVDAPISYSSGNDIGPFGDRDNYQVFIQKVVPYTDQLFVRLSSTGKRICTIKSVDYSTITSFCVHECEGPSRLNSRPRRYLFTGHSNGTVQLWDLTTALELKPSDQNYLGGPTPNEFVKLLDRIELASNSGYSTPTTNCLSPCSNLNLNNNPKLHKSLLINSTNNSNNNIVNLANNSINQFNTDEDKKCD